MNASEFGFLSKGAYHGISKDSYFQICSQVLVNNKYQIRSVGNSQNVNNGILCYYTLLYCS